MKVLLLNQTFYPDVMATAQYLTDLAVDLAERGCDVTVVTGRSAYDKTRHLYPRVETYRGVRIRRLRYTSLGKKSLLSRAIDMVSFNLIAGANLCLFPKFGAVVALTSPPLIALLGMLYSRWRGSRFIHWVMDLNPDEAVAAGFLRKGSLAERILEALSKAVLRNSTHVVVLDRFMAARVRAKGASPDRITVLPPWSHDQDIKPLPHDRNPFREQHRLDQKFVVMYSGNHSPCHPLDTLLETARSLRDDGNILFLFVGGGTGVEHVRRFAHRHALPNIRQLPYQPRSHLPYSLPAADLHVVAMGNPFVGIVHPSKIYGILCTGRPFVLIGPKESHVGDLIARESIAYQVEHSNVQGLVETIHRVRKLSEADRRRISARSRAIVADMFSRRIVSPKLVDLIAGGQSTPSLADSGTGRAG